MVVSLPQNSVVLDDGEKEPSGLERPISAAQALPVVSQDVPAGDIQPIVESTEELSSEQNQQPSQEANTNEDKTQDLF